MLFDIRNEHKAAKTLENLTGVKAERWLAERAINRKRLDYTDEDKDIERIIKENNGHFPELKDIDLVVTHITTCSDKCQSIKENGLLNLKKSYQLLSSDLRRFLDANGIEILVDSYKLKYKSTDYDISFKNCPINHKSKEYAAWDVGRKFYFDFTICGFLSINCNDIYAGLVHKRPEILLNIDNLLDTNLQIQWDKTHEVYEIVFTVPEYNCIYNGWEDNDEYERVMYYLIYAYECICLGPRTTEILCKDSVDILPAQILECNKFDKWR